MFLLHGNFMGPGALLELPDHLVLNLSDDQLAHDVLLFPNAGNAGNLGLKRRGDVRSAHSRGETMEELRRNLREMVEMLFEGGEPQAGALGSNFRRLRRCGYGPTR